MNPMFYFLLALTTVLAATADDPKPVLDMDGNIIFQGRYYVVPVIPIAGGVTLSFSGKPCHPKIVLNSSLFDAGIPVKFSNWSSKVEFVPESENLNIEMDMGGDTICGQPTYWSVDEHKWEDGRWVVTTGKPKVFNFQIVKSTDPLNNRYIFKVCRPGQCIDVGVSRPDDERYRPLSLRSKRVVPKLMFSAVFAKVIVAEDSSKTMSK